MLIPRILKVLGLVGATAFALVSLPGCDRHTNAIKADAAMVAGYGNRVETAGVEVVRLADTIVPAIAKGDDKAITNAVVGLKNIGNDLETTGQKLQSLPEPMACTLDKMTRARVACANWCQTR